MVHLLQCLQFFFFFLMRKDVIWIDNVQFGRWRKWSRRLFGKINRRVQQFLSLDFAILKNRSCSRGSLRVWPLVKVVQCRWMDEKRCNTNKLMRMNGFIRVGRRHIKQTFNTDLQHSHFWFPKFSEKPFSVISVGSWVLTDVWFSTSGRWWCPITRCCQ